ncbi:primosomal protein N' [Polymorphum gilvum]|uniref:Replication restart protein PriA n=1 Tax=Polymorphum gilvum (strain LMG 25793 / CGMCC 1.9160 / SL003B-26A1) TaxID=991905 RepID=F2IVB8_POLGS|nr:primosomal protein N' [Polymorphum gilvum]ADZ72636.1 Putative priA family helicase (Primosomal protein N', replication factor Y) [Polymorphum gilvum SL003B-26A1]
MLFDNDRDGSGTIASVLVPVAVPGPYTYKVPPGLAVCPGTIVRVPLGPREVVGAVWDGMPEPGIDPRKLKAISHVYPAGPLDADMRRFVDWVANWTLSPPGMVLRMVLRSEEALEPEPPVAGVARVEGAAPDRLTPARRRVLDTMQDGFAWTKSGLAGAAGVSVSVIDGLVHQGVLEIVSMSASPAPPAPDPAYNAPALSPAQAAVATGLVAAFDRGYAVSLIDGVTGSGKTEVYFEAVAEAVRRGRQAVVLVPEISLTAQFLKRFEQRFGVLPAEWHSEVAPRRRARVWRGVASGDVRVVVGARSALFLPFHELGLIVVDEEHDTAFKQDDRVPYNARDMAVVRGHLAQFPVILASATPSIESRVNADLGRYTRFVLPERASGGALPELHAIDMRRDGPERGRWLAPALVAAMRETLADNAQSLLFLNRRGYAPLTLCRSCGHRFQCSHCSAWLVEHRFRGRLVCHHCGHSEPVPQACPSCGTVDALVACGPGVERIAEEVEALFPQARTLILSSDLPGGPERLRREMKIVEEGGADIVIGTQLVAKGHNFPLMRLVGVVDADLGLAHGDPRAAERTFQLLAQVTGRAGRFSGGGKGYLQTYSPDHPVIRALLSSDSEAFYAAEIEARRVAGLPPFGRLAALVVSGPDKPATEGYARAVARAAPPDAAVTVLGPAEAALAMVRGRHRFRLLVLAPRQFDMQGYLRGWLSRVPRAAGGLRLQVDIDPQQFL